MIEFEAKISAEHVHSKGLSIVVTDQIPLDPESEAVLSLVQVVSKPGLSVVLWRSQSILLRSTKDETR